MQGNMGVLEDSSDLDCELLSTYIALVASDPSAFALHLGYSLSGAAMRADRTFGPQFRLDKFISGFFIVKARVRKNGVVHGFISFLKANILIFLGLSSIISRRKNPCPL